MIKKIVDREKQVNCLNCIISLASNLQVQIEKYNARYEQQEYGPLSCFGNIVANIWILCRNLRDSIEE